MIYTLTINPAIDTLMFFDALQKNRTNRALRTMEAVGGKGTHVSMNLRLLGEESKAILTVGGHTGTRLLAMLREAGVQTEAIWVADMETRNNVILVEETGDCTILAQRGRRAEAQTLDWVLEALRAALVPGDFLVVCGDGGNCAWNIYPHIIKEFSQKQIRVFLDTSGESLRGSLAAGPFLIKPNLEELSQLCGRELSPERLDEILAELARFDAHGIQVVALSMGREGSLLRRGGEVFRAYAPAVPVQNTIGCGDSYLSGLVYGFYHGMPLGDTLALATAASAATAAHASSVGFDRALMQSLRREVRMEALLPDGRRLPWAN